MSYRQTIDRIALSQLIKPPNIPDFHLMVGSAEYLGNMPLMVYTETKVPTQIVQGWGSLKDTSAEDPSIMQAVADNNLEVNDMNWNLAMIGGGLGGI